MRSLAVLALTLIVPSVLVACGDWDEGGPRAGGVESQAPQISDSAGVRVVTNAVPGANAPTFQLSAKPRASIGTVEGAPEYRLFRASGTVLRDSTILVVNAGTQEARFYDKAGKYLRTLGKEGQGPGEFSHIGLIGELAEDSLLFFDGGQARFEVFTSAGEFARTISSKDLGFSPTVAGLLSNRRVLVRQYSLPTSLPPTGTVTRRPETVVWMELDGGTVLPFSEFPGTESFSLNSGMPLVFGRGLDVVARGDRIAVANNDAYSIRIYDAAGKPVQVVRERRGPVPVRAGEFEEAIPPTLPSGSRPRKNLESQPRLETKPPFGGGCQPGCLHIDQAGNLWVREYQAFMTVGGSTWHVFDPRGAFIGKFDVPAKATILDSGGDWILLNQRDDFDVEHVVLYGLERAAGKWANENRIREPVWSKVADRTQLLVR